MWQVLFWGSLALLLYIYIGYPAILALLARARRRAGPSDADVPDSVCLVISAFNEEAVIRQKIENSLALRFDGRRSVVVASDGSTDRTVAIANEYRDHGVEVLHAPLRRGKNAVLNEIVPVRTEAVVVFTDANSVLSPDALTRLVERFRDASVGCVVGELVYTRDLTAVGQGENLYWRYEGWIKRLESRLGSVLVANGSIFAIRRSLYRQLFSDVANDFQIPFDVANQRKGVVYEPAALAAERSAELWGEEFDRKVRIVLRGFTGFLRLRDRMRGMRLWQFVSHKLLRWSVGSILAVTFVANAFLAGRGTFYAGFMLAQLLCYAAAAIGWLGRKRAHVPRVVYVPFYFTMVNSAAVVAVLQFLVGRRRTVWEKAQSTRMPACPADRTPADDAGAPVAASAGDVNPRQRFIED
jgi:cellulose synthase/poly-beta-1,6-N-acetylglucosamine synthase-like glycosyltransferase